MGRGDAVVDGMGAHHAHRGFIASWPQWGGPVGFFLANLAILVFSTISGGQFLAWGWRVPFWLSIVMVGIGLYIRLGIAETPVFTRLAAQQRLERAPVLEVIKAHPELIILSALARTAEQGPFYIFGGFIFFYGTHVLGTTRDLLLAALMVATVVSWFTIPTFRHLSDRIGRKRMYLLGAIVMGIYPFIYFGLLNTTVSALIFLAIVLSLIPHDMMWGPQAALIAECFPPRMRYSGFSLGFHLASITAGGPAPLIATALFAATGSGYVVACYILFCAIVTIIATALLPDYTNRDISHEREALVGAAPAAAPT